MPMPGRPWPGLLLIAGLVLRATGQITTLQTFPLDWDNVVADPPSTRNLTANCRCDLQEGACDLGCCCDSQCPSGLNSLFTAEGVCLPEGSKQQTLTYCVPKDYVFKVNLPSSSDFYTITKDQAEVKFFSELLCIVTDSNPNLGEAYPDPPAGAVGDNANLAQCPATISPPAKITDYRFRSYVYVQQPNSTTSQPLTVPYPAFSSECNDQSVVGFLVSLPTGSREYYTTCQRDLTALNLSSVCTGSGLLTPQHYSGLRFLTGRGATVAAQPVTVINTQYLNPDTGVLRTVSNATSAYNATAGRCTNVVRYLNVTLYYTLQDDAAESTPGYIDTVELTFVVTDVATSGAAWLQQGVRVSWLPTELPQPIEVINSGNPGYITGFPLLAGLLATTSDGLVDKQAISRMVGGVPVAAPGVGGACSPTALSFVKYGANTTSTCSVSLTASQLKDFCTTQQDKPDKYVAFVLSSLYQSILNNTLYVGEWGDSDVNNINQWLQVAVSGYPFNPSIYSQADNACSGVIVGFDLQIVTGVAFSSNNLQQKVGRAPRRRTRGAFGGARRVPATHRRSVGASPVPALFGIGGPTPGDVLGKDYDKKTPSYDKGRRAGILLHPTSLPGAYGIGELGDEARRFVDWLGEAGMTVWQLLPLVPPDPMFYSPYSGTDANGGNPLVVSIAELVKDGLLTWAEAPATVPVANVDYPAVAAAKQPLLQIAARRLLHDAPFLPLKEEYLKYRKEHPWVEDSALFDVARNLPELSQLAWWEWPEPLRLRQPAALKEFREVHKEAIDEYIVIQYFFEKQWLAIRAYANSRGIKIIGDMPIYVGGHSADVWANRHLFELNDAGLPEQVSGVPPDAFSETGQLWGSPLYRWTAHKQEGYKWWSQRMARALQLYDECRIDHFRGFAGYWSVGAAEETAMNGAWRLGPGLELFTAMKKSLGAVPILAEDLGVITTDVVALREAIGAPGMVVVQFAWGGGPSNVHLPHNHYENCFVYPGTHDNETAVGWFRGSANEGDKAYIRSYLRTDGSDIAWDFIRSCMAAVPRTCVTMMQDVMRLDNTARMNTPGTAAGNWRWRMGDWGVYDRLKAETADLHQVAKDTNRLPPPAKKKAAEAA
ncbi:4-alpha-glucanotransferase DPE1, chloroplastic/amyloplastic [Tetrabaena socialis]|uniref:4-alpha-glucanotransferase n=1 Tax=Tetrabaena socialis TaxID=47790 RepID=A0A2J7ZWG9_9CHLO|nr:4-alpha-glucanotransferase DPE1, chloroplastic/amyloplastic [Tetrabaena socialis]|eukprot:PNH04623.1 4-alpha-glucanotransferase DPE1, chloroplastic/amyloplastic [Tetrabaena socialis]